MNSYLNEDEGFFTQLAKAARHEYGVGPEENRQVMYEARKRKELMPDAPKMEQMLGSYRLPQVINAVRGGKGDADYLAARKEAGIDIQNENLPKKIGSLLGAFGADLTQDSTRRFWWLLNASQAVGEIGAEQAFRQANPELYKEEPTGKQYMDKHGEMKDVKKRKYKPGYVQALAIPAGVAINTGLGLMTPFGGAEGYKAAIPSEEDPTKTGNLLGEVALKYFMGRTGNLLPYSEFVKVRPDVSREEYNRYKAFKFDKKEDWNPLDDGQTSMLAGALRTTAEGIHGPEVQFLGRSLPVTTGLIPYASAIAGGVAGVRSKKPIRHGFLGSSAGLVAGQIAGNIIENERRRRNTVENELDGTLQ